MRPLSNLKGFFVTGTDTAVGKTEVAGYMARMFSEDGFRVGVMKPVATGVEGTCNDARILKESCTSEDPMDSINPVFLRMPLAPLVAAKKEHKKIDLGIIWDRFRELSSYNDLMIVEGIGGVMVPIAQKGKRTFYVLDMILRIKLPVIIVARPGLGTINHILMTIGAIRTRKAEIAGIVFNHTCRIKRDASIKTNPALIERLSGVKVLGIMEYNQERSKRRIRWLKGIGHYEDKGKFSYNRDRKPAVS